MRANIEDPAASRPSAPSPLTSGRVAICVCTYRRPDQLDELLTRLEVVAADAGGLAEVDVVIVDDDAAASARDVVAAHSAAFGGRVRYVVAGSGNISVARNTALTEGVGMAEYVAFIDDDCVPGTDWLRQLLLVQRRFDADVVTGHCHDLPPPGAPRWYVNEPWVAESDRGTDGEVRTSGPLKNSLFRSSALETHSLRFDLDFGKTGGEDALFFLRVAAAGLRHVHASQAVVEEVVPLERVTLRYQLHRALWFGNTEARTYTRAGVQSRARIAAGSVKRVLAGPAHVLSRVARGRNPQWRWAAAISCSGIGRLVGAAGVRLLHATINRGRSGAERRPLRRLLGTWQRPYDGMFSVVIPTLQKSPLLEELVAQFSDSRLVREVLIINNAAPEPLVIDDPKVRVIDTDGNIFVNPAWNLGAELATADYLIVANDDLLLPPKLIDHVAARLGPRVGIIGPHFHCYERPPGALRFRRAYDRQFAFGTLMFLARKDYVPIPDDLKIWCGDDWLFNRQRRRNYEFTGVEIHSPMSVTSSQSKFDQLKELDEATFYARHGANPYRARFRLERAVIRRFAMTPLSRRT